MRTNCTHPPVLFTNRKTFGPGHVRNEFSRTDRVYESHINKNTAKYTHTHVTTKRQPVILSNFPQLSVRQFMREAVFPSWTKSQDHLFVGRGVCEKNDVCVLLQCSERSVGVKIASVVSNVSELCGLIQVWD